MMFSQNSKFDKHNGPLKVLVVSQFLNVEVGGAERYIQEVCKRLERDYSMELRYLSSDTAAAHVLSPPCVHFMSTGFHPAWSKETDKFLERFRPHMVYAHHTVPGLTDVLIRVAEKYGIPTVLMYHSDVTGADLLKKSIGFLYHRIIGEKTLKTCRKLFISSHIYASASPFLKRFKTRWVEAPPGVDSLMLSGKRSAARPYLLFVGKPALESKGFEILFRAWLQLRQKWVDLELVVVGSLNEHPWKWRQDGIRYLGYVNSRQTLADVYASAAITVLPSISSSESFGMVLAESLLAGSPIVGSNIGGIPVLVENGLNGYLFSPGDVTQLITVLNHALRRQHELREYISRKQEVYQAQFSWDRTAAIVADTISSTLKLNAAI